MTSIFYRLLACIGVVVVIADCAVPPGVQFNSHGLKPAKLSGTLYSPEGNGPFPAIVALHGYGGFLDYQDDWLKKLSDLGFVTLMVDSYCERGYYCPGQSRSRLEPLMRDPMTVSPATRADDALGGLQYLQSLPFVDPERIGVLGWTGGATAALIASARTSGFKAAVAFYPSVSDSQRQHEALTPILILAGERDPNAAEYRSFADTARKKRRPVEVVLYPGAYRKFDEPGGMINVLGIKQEYNPAAARDADNRLKSFFAKHLGRK